MHNGLGSRLLLSGLIVRGGVAFVNLDVPPGALRILAQGVKVLDPFVGMLIHVLIHPVVDPLLSGINDRFCHF